jgi:hypothetical protein
MTLRCIECPEYDLPWATQIEDREMRLPHRKVFLAGGITGCPDWQAEVVDQCQRSYRSAKLTLVNPRRKNFPIDDPTAAEDQIRWEHYMLRKVDGIAFWFPEESICPISLYELGAWSMIPGNLFVGVHPNYVRRLDVAIQTRLARCDVVVHHDLEALVEDILNFSENGGRYAK